MKFSRLSTLSLILAVAVITLGYANYSSAAPPCSKNPREGCVPDGGGGGGGEEGNLSSADCTLPSDGYILSNDGNGDYENLVNDVQCTIGHPRKGKHKLNTGDGDDERMVWVKYDLEDANCMIFDLAISEFDSKFSHLTEINTQTQGNLFTIQLGPMNAEQIPMYIDIADARPNFPPQRIKWGGEVKGTSCGSGPLVTCIAYNDIIDRCEAWTIEIGQEDAQACFSADAGPIKPAASECNIAFLETVRLQQ